VGRGGGRQDYPQGKHRSVAQDVQGRAGDRGPEGASSLSFPSVLVTLTLMMTVAAHRPLCPCEISGILLTHQGNTVFSIATDLHRSDAGHLSGQRTMTTTILQ